MKENRGKKLNPLPCAELCRAELSEANELDYVRAGSCDKRSAATTGSRESNSKTAGLGHVELLKGNINSMVRRLALRKPHPADNAFTLSEVLITLVVIGIIAAITIPAISRSSEKYILKNQFKKSYSTIMNAINKADTDLGGNTQCYYGNLVQTASVTSDCAMFFEQMFANLNVQKVCNGNAKRDGCIPTPYLKYYYAQESIPGFSQEKIENNSSVYNLADGTIIIMYGTWRGPLFLVDVNGAKGPNMLGKDVLRFNLVSDGAGIYIRDQIYDFGNLYPHYFRTLKDIYGE